MIRTSLGIETRYHGPTNHNGSRISARRTQGPLGRPNRAEVWVGWDYALDDNENHHRAALELAKKLDWEIGTYGISTERGFVWGLA